MTNRENLIGLFRRQGYERMPLNFSMCPDLYGRFVKYCEETGFPYPESAFVGVPFTHPKQWQTPEFWAGLYEQDFKPGTFYNMYGVAHEPGGENCFHMWRMYHPLEHMTELAELDADSISSRLLSCYRDDLRVAWADYFVKAASHADTFRLGKSEKYLVVTYDEGGFVTRVAIQ